MEDNIMSPLPHGLTSLEPMLYGQRRWNGAIWPDTMVDRYNHELARIASRHASGMDVQHLVNGLYNLAQQFDYACK